MNIKKYDLPFYQFNWSHPFAIIGNGESGSAYQFNPDEINLICINRAIARQKRGSIAATMYHHTDFMTGWIAKYLPDRGIDLLTIRLQDIASYRLHGGDTLNMIVQYVVERMPAGGTVYLSGVDFGYSRNEGGGRKDWQPQIDRLAFCQGVAVRRGVKIVLLCENPRLAFL
jgi:hypothetical protein